MLTVFLHYGSVNLQFGCGCRAPDPLQHDAEKRKRYSLASVAQR